MGERGGAEEEEGELGDAGGKRGAGEGEEEQGAVVGQREQQGAAGSRGEAAGGEVEFGQLEVGAAFEKISERQARGL